MTHPILDTIQIESDIKKIPEEFLPQLCDEIRSVILETVSKNGGHLASSLGAVEIIVALHKVFDMPDDKIIFDVGHQSYAHKILTDRRNSFSTLRQSGGISGFPKREESLFDSFNTGHASTSISAGLGILRGQRLNGNTSHVVCLIGDGALTGGLAYEALDDAGESKLPLIVVLNDNEMSISKNVGGLSRTLSHMRTSRGYRSFKRSLAKSLDYGLIGRFLSKHLDSFKNRVKRFVLSNTLFEELGFTYLGPIDGHNIKALIQVFSEARELGKPVLIHTFTKKGKGYSYAEKDPQKFHGVGPFDISTGKLLHPHEISCTDVFSDALCTLAKSDARICAITAAMPQGTGLDKFYKTFPKRFFDVGIAEEHAVTMAAGMASVGKRPIVAIYSSFLQRAADEIFHDVCLQNLPVVFAADRAGLVGRDGETHNGVLDVALLYHMPNLEIFVPASFEELKAVLAYCIDRNGPSLIRYNRGPLPIGSPDPFLPYHWKTASNLSALCLISYGVLLTVCEEAVRIADKKVCLINANTIKPIDQDILIKINTAGHRLLVVEEGPPVLAKEISLRFPNVPLRSICIDNVIVQQGSIEEQRKRCGIDAESIAKAILEMTESMTK